MPGGPNYPKDRVASTKYEKGGVTKGAPDKPVSGKELMKTGRAGKGK
jgi:hypothetical protein